MTPKGTLLVSDSFVSRLPQFRRYDEKVRGEFLTVMDIAVDGSGYLCLGDGFLIDVDKPFALVFIPFIKQEGILIPTDKTTEEQMIFRGKAMLDNVYLMPPAEQLQWIFKNYPEYQEREKKGEFYPNPMYPHIFADLMRTLDKKIKNINL